MAKNTIWSDVFLNDDHKALAMASRDFAEKEIAPLAAKIDEEHLFPKEIIKQLGQMGYLGICVSPEWGGAGMDSVSYTVALEEISVACASTSVIMSVNNSLVCHPIEKFGSLLQKEKYLKPLANGEKLGCYCLSEPGSGSDAAAMKTRAVKKGKNWILNGVKNFITNGEQADVAVIYAMVDPAKKHKGIAGFLVDRNTKGYSVGKTERKLGIRGSSTTQIILENVEVSEENLIGTEEDGFKIAMNTLDGGRIGIATQALGIGRVCLEEALQYSTEREAFGKPIHQLGQLQLHLATMATKVEAARYLIRAAAILKDQGRPFSKAAAEAKLFASETCMEVATKGIQVLGGYGYTQDYPMERHFRDAKITEIYEGTSEIQRLVIASNLVKEIS